jgi:hypothetical protein
LRQQSKTGAPKTTVKFGLEEVSEDVYGEKDRFCNSARHRCLCHFPRSTGSEQTPQPSGTGTVKFSDGKTITVDYSSPRMRGRKIFGNLVPYGEIWRTGANEATTFVIAENLVTVKGTSVPASNYTIFTVPNPDKWTLIINKHTGEGGTPSREAQPSSTGQAA